MKLREEIKDNILVIRIDENRVDSNVSSELKTELLRLVETEDVVHLLVDLKNVEYVDSSGLGALLFGHRLVKSNDGVLKLLHPNQKVKTLIKIANLEEILTAYQDEQEALDSFN